MLSFLMNFKCIQIAAVKSTLFSGLFTLRMRDKFLKLRFFNWRQKYLA